ncbi:MAG: hypothetical protein E7587_05400 [Ruminococcaceae bacterium]|nr:hypothetical protein [Oscillospiraceae bacterium]
MDISLLDKNFASLGADDGSVEWISSHDERFSLHGVYFDEQNGLYMRVPDEVSEKANRALLTLAKMTAGGRLRFVTDSPLIAIKASLPAFTPMPHMSITGSHGFSVYIDGHFRARYSPKFEDFIGVPSGLSGRVCFAEKKNFADCGRKRVVDIYFPLYGGVAELYIGLANGSSVERAPEYTYKKPLLFYGSSITQGACVSRPGNDYIAILARRLDSDYVNLGFSGNGNAEDAIIDYISSIDASVYAFDYNLYRSRPERVLPPHYSIYERIREKHPDAGILLYDKPGCDYEGFAEREDIIRSTYERAKEQGDSRVAFVPTKALLGEGERDCCMTDPSHPNDLGAMRVADALYPAIKELLEHNN